MEICDLLLTESHFLNSWFCRLTTAFWNIFFLFIISIAILGDGSVVSWGDADFGDDIPAVRHQLKGVEQIQATQRAFAAILEDGSVVAWGHAEYGGDSSAVRDQPKGVQQIQATPNGAFAAILEDGSVITLGNSRRGGDSSAV